MPQIHIPSPLRQYTGKKSSVNVLAVSVGEALKNLVEQHPDLKRHLYTEEGKLRSFVNVYVNDEDMRYLDKEATALNDGDTISIVPSIAGGSFELRASGSELIQSLVARSWKLAPKKNHHADHDRRQTRSRFKQR